MANGKAAVAGGTGPTAGGKGAVAAGNPLAADGNGATSGGSGVVPGGNGATACGSELVAGGSGPRAGGNGVVAGGSGLTTRGNGPVARGRVPWNDRARKGAIGLACWLLTSSAVSRRVQSKQTETAGRHGNGTRVFIDLNNDSIPAPMRQQGSLQSKWTEESWIVMVK